MVLHAGFDCELASLYDFRPELFSVSDLQFWLFVFVTVADGFVLDSQGGVLPEFVSEDKSDDAILELVRESDPVFEEVTVEEFDWVLIQGGGGFAGLVLIQGGGGFAGLVICAEVCGAVVTVEFNGCGFLQGGDTLAGVVDCDGAATGPAKVGLVDG